MPTTRPTHKLLALSPATRSFSAISTTLMFMSVLRDLAALEDDVAVALDGDLVAFDRDVAVLLHHDLRRAGLDRDFVVGIDQNLLCLEHIVLLDRFLVLAFDVLLEILADLD